MEAGGEGGERTKGGLYSSALAMIRVERLGHATWQRAEALDGGDKLAVVRRDRGVSELVTSSVT
jgi:hypothetical protein